MNAPSDAEVYAAWDAIGEAVQRAAMRLPPHVLDWMMERADYGPAFPNDLMDAKVRGINVKGEREGWALFRVDGGPRSGLFEIQRDDQRARFKSDDEAMAHVRRQAEVGKYYAVWALELHHTRAAWMGKRRKKAVAS